MIKAGKLDRQITIERKGETVAASGAVSKTWAPVATKSAEAARSGAVADSGQVVNINAPVTVNASGGTPEQNADLAKRVSREMEATMRGVVVDEMRRQMRPGNIMNNRRL